MPPLGRILPLNIDVVKMTRIPNETPNETPPRALKLG